VCGTCGWWAATWATERGIGALQLLGVPVALGIAITLVALDAVAYAWHRANHRVPLLWRFHRVHHADEAFHVSTALRFHPGELLLALPVRLFAVVLLGAPPIGVLVFEVVFGVANVLEHGNFDLSGRLERALGSVLILPATHRRHHSRVRSELDSNFGTIFCAWDRLAGTLTPGDSAATFATGLPHREPLDPASLVWMLLEPLRRRA
jgi:sterol desaturase/sphingolipid hydroxylase (fatty acid hydroxylase superfamily)